MKPTAKSFYTWDFLTDFKKVDLETTSKESSEILKPLSKNIKASKNTVVYGAHSYHTKVPPEGIIPYIKHFTKPGDVVLDPFSGSGMTGVAGLLIEKESKKCARTFILNDLGPAAIHLTYNHNTYCSPGAIRTAFNALLKGCESEIKEIYQTWEPIDSSKKISELVSSLSFRDLKKAKRRELLDGSVYLEVKFGKQTVVLAPAQVTATVWSESYICNGSKGKKCGEEVTTWDHGFDQKKGTALKTLKCPSCGTTHSRSSFGSAIKSVPAFVESRFYNPTTGKNVRSKRSIYAFEREIALSFSRDSIKDWYPQDSVAATKEMMTMGPAKLGVKTVADFYTNRNLKVCSIIWREISKIKDKRLQKVLAFAATNTFWHATKMRRFNARGGSRPLTGTLYIPQVSIECNVLDVYSKKIQMLEKYYSYMDSESKSRSVHFSLGSATNLPIPDNSVDYIFTDPPFGGNIYYSDCSVIWEGWLGSFTDEKFEMHFNRVRKPEQGGKTITDYEQLMLCGYKEMFRVLKPGRWASIVFNNSDDRVLEMFRSTAEIAGFEIGEVAFFDKVQKSFKGYLGREGKQNVTNCDIILNIRKRGLKENTTVVRKRNTISDNWIRQQVERYLTSLPKLLRKQHSAYTTEHRTLPFIHNALMKAVFAENQSFDGFSLPRIETVLREAFIDVEGLWYTRTQHKGLDRQLRLDVA